MRFYTLIKSSQALSRLLQVGTVRPPRTRIQPAGPLKSELLTAVNGASNETPFQARLLRMRQSNRTLIVAAAYTICGLCCSVLYAVCCVQYAVYSIGNG